MASYTAVASDPRKRRATGSPDRNEAQQKRHTNLADPRNRGRQIATGSPYRDAYGTNGEAHRQNSDQVRGASQAGAAARPSPQAPTAPMGGDNANKRKFSQLMLDSFMQGAVTATCRINHTQAEAVLQKAIHEFRANQSLFAEFPAIQESKTTAKEKAEKKCNVAKQELRLAVSRQEQLANELSDLFCQVTEVVPPPPPPPPPIMESRPSVDIVSREQYEKLQAELSDVRDSVQSMKNTISATSNEILSQVDNKIAAVPRNDFTADIEAIVVRAESLETSLRELHSSTATAADLKSVQSLVNALDSRVGHAEEISRSRPQVAASAAQPAAVVDQDLTPVHQRIQQIEDSLAMMESDITAVASEIVVEQINAFKQELDQNVTAQNAAIDACSSAAMVSTGDIASLRTDVQTTKGNQLALQMSIDQIKGTVTDLSEQTSNFQQQPSVNGQTPGLLRFAPVAPSDEDVQDRNIFETQPVDNTNPAFNGLHLKHMKAEIDMLKERERLHTHQYNNLTTDNVVEMMVDQLAKQYPDVKNARAALTAMSRNLEALRETNKNEVELLRENISGIQASLASVHGKLKDSMSDATQRIGRAEDVIGKAEEEITNVRNELSKLASKVDLHAKAVEFGQTQFEQTSKDLKQAKMDVSAMESGLTALREIIIKRNDGSTNGTT